MIMPRLHEIARNGTDPSAITACLRKAGDDANVDEKDNMGNTALHYAARGGNTVISRALIENGASIDLQNPKGQSALYFAVVGHQPDEVQLLLDQGADPSVIAKTGYAPLHYAARHGLNSILKQLLIAKADFTAKTAEGKSPLVLAKENKQQNTVAILEHFAETGTVEGVVDQDVLNASAEDADIMRELMELEVKPSTQFASPPKQLKVSPNKTKSPGGDGGESGGDGGAENDSGSGGGGGCCADDDCNHNNSKIPEGYERVVTGAPSPEKMNLITSEPNSTQTSPSHQYAVVDKLKKTPMTSPTLPPVKNISDGPRPSSMYVHPEHIEATKGNGSKLASPPSGKGLWVDDVKGAVKDRNKSVSPPKHPSPPKPVSPSPNVASPLVEDLYDNADAAVEVHNGQPIVPEDTYDNSEFGASADSTYDNSEAGLPSHISNRPLPAPPVVVEADYADIDELEASKVVYADTSEFSDIKVDRQSRIVIGDRMQNDMETFLCKLSLPVATIVLAAGEAGIDTPEDFKLFSEEELVKEHKFKVGHVRKILKAL